MRVGRRLRERKRRSPLERVRNLGWVGGGRGWEWPFVGVVVVGSSR